MAKNPIDEFLSLKKEASEKKAGFGDAMKAFPSQMGSAAAGAVAAGAVGLVGAGLHHAVSSIMDAATKGHDFRQMMGANEDLHPHYEADPKRFNMMFNTLRTVNPQFSKDPLVAGSFMRRMIESPTGIGGIAGEALKQRGDFPETAFGEALNFAREGAKSGLNDSFSAARGTREGEFKNREFDLKQQEFEYRKQQDARRQQERSARPRRPMHSSDEEE